ncbi:hypothetical protein HEMROJRC1_01820 [Rodentibacter sp. JRC1]|uniref:ferric reductase-like transmembrane domain-containing protein n=1 Tax=Rodentibacter TaxID=1960084 RepID=UPI001CFD1009|nr:ferric reductase-like transmembrane domain-containing protein [Rodentibacter sp. JRC1]GJI55070.1 hypothetical protein HEMROJRC1_01820 [Rodentibacter sp. JRC1]
MRYLLLRFFTHIICASPLIWLSWLILSGDETQLGAEPSKTIQHFLGFTAITLLLGVFLFRFVIEFTKLNQLRILHRTLGLWAIFYLFLHILSYFILELGYDISLFYSELTQRYYLILGALSLFILCFITISYLPFIRHKMKAHWLTLHKLAYLALLLACIHYLLSTKNIEITAIIYLLLCLGTLLIICYRKYVALNKK